MIGGINREGPQIALNVTRNGAEVEQRLGSLFRLSFSNAGTHLVAMHIMNIQERLYILTLLYSASTNTYSPFMFSADDVLDDGAFVSSAYKAWARGIDAFTLTPKFDKVRTDIRFVELHNGDILLLGMRSLVKLTIPNATPHKFKAEEVEMEDGSASGVTQYYLGKLHCTNAEVAETGIVAYYGLNCTLQMSQQETPVSYYLDDTLFLTDNITSDVSAVLNEKMVLFSDPYAYNYAPWFNLLVMPHRVVAVKRLNKMWYVLTEKEIYVYNIVDFEGNTTLVGQIALGIESPEAVCVFSGALYIANQNGIYRYTSGDKGGMEVLSAPVDEYFRGGADFDSEALEYEFYNATRWLVSAHVYEYAKPFKFMRPKTWCSCVDPDNAKYYLSVAIDKTNRNSAILEYNMKTGEFFLHYQGKQDWSRVGSVNGTYGFTDNVDYSMTVRKMQAIKGRVFGLTYFRGVSELFTGGGVYEHQDERIWYNSVDGYYEKEMVDCVGVMSWKAKPDMHKNIAIREVSMLIRPYNVFGPNDTEYNKLILAGSRQELSLWTTAPASEMSLEFIPINVSGNKAAFFGDGSSQTGYLNDARMYVSRPTLEIKKKVPSVLTDEVNMMLIIRKRSMSIRAISLLPDAAEQEFTRADV